MSYFVIKPTGNELYEKAFLTVRVFNRLGLPCLIFNGSSSLSRLCWTFEKISQLLRFPSSSAQQYNVAPQLNSEFSRSDNVYIVKGDRNTQKPSKKSKLAKSTEFIEPNYIYTALEVPNDPDYSSM